MPEDRFRRAMEAFDALNGRDPNTETADGKVFPRELLYAMRMSRELQNLDANASEALQLAARAQHLERWQIPRDEYPRDRSGYKRWRLALANRHAERAGEVLSDCGYDPETIAAVQRMLRKEQLKRDPEVQTLEDVACLVFLRYHFADFARQHPQEKIVGILRKTWNKMSDRGRNAALQLDLPPESARLISAALGEESG